MADSCTLFQADGCGAVKMKRPLSSLLFDHTKSKKKINIKMLSIFS